MPAVSETALAHHHDDSLTSAARVLAPVAEPVDREAAASELRQAFCAQLRSARERRGISLQAISEATKVSENLFVDLERGDVSRWPTGIYRRAFFREYAALVGLPVEFTLSEFVRLFPDELANGAANDALVPGPLRLTMARPFWKQVSAVRARAAGIDLLIVFSLSMIMTALSITGIWTSLAIVALTYHLAGTALMGGSPAQWFVRARVWRKWPRSPWLLVAMLAAGAPTVDAQTFTPEVGQPGKDVVWVPTPEAMVERMLDLAKVTPKDFVMDLGSGDGRNVIGAAKRGASALGVEYNPDMVALSKRLATAAGVAERAQFVQGDMFEADISKADVLAIFLLPSNMLRLRDKFFNLRPGSRIVSNTFTIQDWDSDEQVEVADCEQWCTAHLYIVPAKIGGTWRMGNDTLDLKQDFQMLSGTLTSNGQASSVFGQLRGNEVSFKAGGRAFNGHVQGNEIRGTIKDGSATADWRATRR